MKGYAKGADIKTPKASRGIGEEMSPFPIQLGGLGSVVSSLNRGALPANDFSAVSITQNALGEKNAILQLQ